MEFIDKFNEFIKNNTISAKSYHPYFQEALNYMLLCGGKHFRAKLLLGVVDIYNPLLLKDAFKVALGVEMIHTYSLVHDDLPVMDNANLRRGHETTHVKFDEVTALLVGDALNTMAFYEISTSNFSSDIKVKCIETLSKNAFNMVVGQALDCYFEKKKLDLEKLKFLHLHKTGALIAGSLEIGARICELDEKICDQIYKIGLELGLAFQIQDDIIDATKNSKEAGKTTNNDIFKNSFVNLLGLDEAINFKNEVINTIENKTKDKLPLLTPLFTDLINKHLKG